MARTETAPSTTRQPTPEGLAQTLPARRGKRYAAAVRYVDKITTDEGVRLTDDQLENLAARLLDARGGAA